MTFSLTYPTKGRGNFATNAQLGGTLNVKRDGPGPYYASPANPGVRMPGLTGALAVRNGTSCDVNDYAVHMACKALQKEVGVKADGILGPNSNDAIRAYQTRNGLYIDGLIGPKTCRLMFEPLVIAAVAELNRTFEGPMMMMCKGHMWVESGYDPGAVGESTPKDLGPGLNGDANPEMSAEFRLTPATAIPAMVKIVDGNIFAARFDFDVAILAYNIGRGGASSWVKAGRPARFLGVDTYVYINKVKEAGAS